MKDPLSERPSIITTVTGISGRVYEYDARRPLARAGQSDIYKATCAGLSVPHVAIKLFKATTQFARREREIDILCKLEHQGIVNIVDELRDTSGLATGIVLELLTGQTLSTFIKTRPDLTKRLEIFARILDAIEYTHSKGVFHHDLKLGNVMVEPDERVVVLDFGLAYVLGSDPITAMGYMIGTPTTMAPEMCSVGPDSRASNAGDIFSLGVMLYEMITLQPYRKHAVEAAYDTGMDSRRGSVSRHFRSFPEGIALEDLLSDMLQREQNRRPSVSVVIERFRLIDIAILARTYTEEVSAAHSSDEPTSHRDAPTKADTVRASAAPPTPVSSDSLQITSPTLVSPIFKIPPKAPVPVPVPPIPVVPETPSEETTNSSLYITMAIILLVGFVMGFVIHALR